MTKACERRIRLKILIQKASPWSLDSFWKSQHPEYVAIRDLVLKHPEIKYVLIGFGGNEYSFFRDIRKNVVFYNLPSSNRVKDLLSRLIMAMIVVIQRPSFIIGLGLFNFAVLGFPGLIIGARFVGVVIAELSFFQPEQSWRRNRAIDKLVRFSLRPIVKNAEAFLTINESLQKFLIETYLVPFSKIKVYRYKISEIFNPSVPRSLKVVLNELGPIVLANCRIAPRKGLHFLIMASRKVIAQVPNVKIVIRGSARGSVEVEYKQYLFKLIDRYALSSNITLIDEYIPYNDLPRYLISADVYVLPSLDESLGISILEALACGIPVIATKVGGIPEIVEDGVTGLLVKPQDSEELAKALIQLLTDEKKRKIFSENALLSTKVTGDNQKEFGVLLEECVKKANRKGFVN